MICIWTHNTIYEQMSDRRVTLDTVLTCPPAFRLLGNQVTIKCTVCVCVCVCVCVINYFAIKETLKNGT